MDVEHKIQLLLSLKTPVYEDCLFDAVTRCTPTTIKALIDAGAKVNYWSKARPTRSVLGYALRSNNPDKIKIVQLLLEAGADPNSQDVRDNVCKLPFEILQMVVKAGAKDFTREHIQQVILN